MITTNDSARKTSTKAWLYTYVVFIAINVLAIYTSVSKGDFDFGPFFSFIILGPLSTLLGLINFIIAIRIALKGLDLENRRFVPIVVSGLSVLVLILLSALSNPERLGF